MDESNDTADMHRALRAAGIEYTVTQNRHRYDETTYYITHIWNDTRIVDQHISATNEQAHRWAADNYPDIPCEDPTQPPTGSPTIHFAARYESRPDQSTA